MAAGESHAFNAEKIFVGLLAFTLIEVAWGYVGDSQGWGRGMLWGGLLFWAWWKFYLIAIYFMHLKWERWIIKGLLVPTPFFILYALLMINPDVGGNDRLVYGHNGTKLQASEAYEDSGTVVEMTSYDNDPEAEH